MFAGPMVETPDCVVVGAVHQAAWDDTALIWGFPCENVEVVVSLVRLTDYGGMFGNVDWVTDCENEPVPEVE